MSWFWKAKKLPKKKAKKLTKLKNLNIRCLQKIPLTANLGFKSLERYRNLRSQIMQKDETVA